MLQGKESNAPVIIQIHGVTLVKVHQLQMAIKKGVKLFYFYLQITCKNRPLFTNEKEFSQIHIFGNSKFTINWLYRGKGKRKESRQRIYLKLTSIWKRIFEQCLNDSWRGGDKEGYEPKNNGHIEGVSMVHATSLSLHKVMIMINRKPWSFTLTMHQFKWP